MSFFLGLESIETRKCKIVKMRGIYPRCKQNVVVVFVSFFLDVNDTHGPTARLRTCYIDKNMPTYVYIDTYIHTHMHTHTYIQRTSRVATSVLSGRLVLAKVQADQKKRIITGSEYSSPPPSQTRFCRKAAPLACKRNTLDKKTSLNISFGTRGSIILKFARILFIK